ncbi:ABC transporter ATP-binding protein [Elstera sp.]|jgi:ATP-binding cassette subfamily C protein|uniref:ABC transporter ATP-binding protein n=1 Tax=Elstera sp. TaxID=1916664 RepID=UPI0037C01296
MGFFSRKSLKPLRTITRQTGFLWRDIVATSGPRFWQVAVLASVAALVQGGGLLLLHPILQILGLAGSAPPRFPVLGALGQAVGLGGALAFYVALITASGALIYAQTMAALHLVIAYGDTLRNRLYHAIMAVEWDLATNLRPATLAQSLTREVSQCGWAVQQAVQLFATVLQVPVLLAVAMVLSPLFTAIACGLAVLVAVALLPLNRRNYALAARFAGANRALHAEVADELAGLRILKVLRAETVRSAAFFQQVTALRSRQIDQARASGLAGRAQTSLAAAVVAAAVWFGLETLALSLADVLTLVLIFARILMLVQRLQDQGRQIIRVLPIFETIRRQIETYRAATEPEATEAPVFHQEIRLENLGYRYTPTGPWAVRGIDAIIPVGSITAVIGPSGAGKSTLADLLMGLTEAREGRIKIDGVPLTGGTRVAWRRRVAYVPQDPFLFHDSLRANLLLAKPDAREEDLWRALDRAAAGFVRQLPEGLETRMGERGTRLSGGERQRIALARALLQEPDLLVMDEATSALDDDTEQQILHALARARGQVTMLVIAHRSASIALADRQIILTPPEPQSSSAPQDS